MDTMLTRRDLLAGFSALPFFRRAAGASSFSLAKGESPTMDQRVSLLTLGVKDLAVSKKFYVDGLGWKLVFENKEIIFFQTGGMVFALFLRDHLAEDFGADPKTFGRAPMALGYNVRAKSDVDSIIQRARSAGAAILDAAKERSWGGYSGYFADPDGFAWEVAWNPAWRLAPDGSVEFGPPPS
jgi:catechol 2,3-dioxygenase-like lactoylglutathione lyase family enzyme